MEGFWVKQLNIRNLHLAIACNDNVAEAMMKRSKKKWSINFDSLSGQFFFTLRIKTIFINVDWT